MSSSTPRATIAGTFSMPSLLRPVGCAKSAALWPASAPGSARAALRVAHHRLLVVLQPDLVDQLQLGLQPVDVLLGVIEDVDQQLAGHEVSGGLAKRNRM